VSRSVGVLTILGSLALVACGGRVEVDAAGPTARDAGHQDGAGSNATAVLTDCVKFCQLIESSFPACIPVIMGPEKRISCSSWCMLGAPDAEFTTCSAEELTYLACVVRPGNFQGCSVDDAGVGSFIDPACDAANQAFEKCAHPW
jgi:hypothetical protein